MLASQNFESYPKLGGDGVRQSTNYALGGGGTSTTKQFRPTSGTQPVSKKQQITQPGQADPAAVKPPPPGVATQAPSPSAQPRPTITSAPVPARPTGGGTPATAGGAPVRPVSGGTPVIKRAPPAAAAPADGGVAGAPTKFNVENLIAQLVGNPSGARRQGMQDMFTRLTGDMSERVNEDAARRGLDFTSVPTDIFARESGDLAARMTEAEGLASADDFRNAVSMAQGFGQQGIDNSYRDREANRDWEQTGFTNELGLRDQDLEEMLAGHGMSQDDFGNQMTSRNQRLRELQMLMGIGDYSQAPLNTAVDAGFDWSGAMGEQAGGSADLASRLAELLPFFNGGGGGAPIPGTPPFNPTSRPRFNPDEDGTYGIPGFAGPNSNYDFEKKRYRF